MCLQTARHIYIMDEMGGEIWKRDEGHKKKILLTKV